MKRQKYMKIQTRIWLLAGLYLGPGSAFGQTVTKEENGLSIVVNAPTGDDGGRIDCEISGTESCAPLNLASCTSEDRPINVQLSADTPVEVTTRLLVFVTDDGDCTFAQEADLDGRPLSVMQLNDSSDPLVTSDRFNFPADFDNDGGDYSNVAAILDASGACDEPVNNQIFRLCFVASPDNDTAESNDPFAAMQMLIDTVAPEAPTISVDPADSRLGVEIDSDNQDIRAWTVRYRIASDNASCDTWSEAERTDRTFVQANQGATTVEIEVENGNEYELCVFGEDNAGNTGAVSDNEIAMPRDECDFIECFPGELDDGYCGAAGSPGLLALLTLTGLLGYRRRRPC